ncbi:hypothetical protein NHX12_027779 [Muraenolepis orangiensis]|uniref:Uncharacterized protein n=1 Tax=Muraenolepis orangiensis TaxID=630683 RepID=A0A9Q0EHZ5_9TELE|nr:hypothetical protein NHX12_027779 [Muraenolepis orangiensis]
MVVNRLFCSAKAPQQHDPRVELTASCPLSHGDVSSRAPRIRTPAHFEFPGKVASRSSWRRQGPNGSVVSKGERREALWPAVRSTPDTTRRRDVVIDDYLLFHITFPQRRYLVIRASPLNDPVG